MMDWVILQSLIIDPGKKSGFVYMPILAQNCSECHAPGKQGFEASGLDTTSHAALMKGGKFGAIVKPGDAFTSALNMLVEGRVDKSIRMPHGRKKLSDDEIAILKTWVNEGAKNN